MEAKYWSSARATGSTLVCVAEDAMLSEAERNENTESVGDDGRGDDPRLNDRLRGETLEPAFTARFGED